MNIARSLFLFLLFLFLFSTEAQKQREIPKKKKNEKQSLYNLLGVEESASEKDIRRAYRKLALAYHPDKIQGNDPEKQKATEQLFVKLASAYEVLSDETTRKRYDYLLSVGTYEYEPHRDWTEFDAKHGLGPQKNKKKGPRPDDPLQFAREQFESAEDPDFYAFWGALIGATIMSVVPAYIIWKNQKTKKPLQMVDKAGLREGQQLLGELQKERQAAAAEEAERQREANEYNKQLQAERRKAKEEADEDEDEDEDEKEGSDDDDGERTDKGKSSGKGSFKCQLCKKNFKSEKQFSNHEQSNAHKKMLKMSERQTGKKEKPAKASKTAAAEEEETEQSGTSKGAKNKQATKKAKQQQQLAKLQQEIGEADVELLRNAQSDKSETKQKKPVEPVTEKAAKKKRRADKPKPVKPLTKSKKGSDDDDDDEKEAASDQTKSKKKSKDDDDDDDGGDD